MIVSKSVTFKGIMQFAGQHLWWLAAWMILVTALYKYTQWKWMSIPWLPLSVIGTAVAFYVGFKNNQAYDRLWEARKVWGGIVNSSRAWGSMVKAFIHSEQMPQAELNARKKQLVYRHIAWLYTLRQQLLVPTSWEHVSLWWVFGSLNRRRRNRRGVGMFDGGDTDDIIAKYLPAEEHAANKIFANAAAQMIDKQTQELAKLHEEYALDLFKQLELQKVLNDFCDNQGRAERIKKFPLPRQYGSSSFMFVCIFIFLLPFGIVGEFSKLGSIGMWLAVPFGVIVGWVYVVMELIGDYSENPFEGLPNDVPMLSICRTIEIDLLQQLGETDLPAPVQAHQNILL